MKDILENLKIKILKARFKRAFNPDPVFLKSAREKFLNAIGPAPVLSPRPHYHALRLGYALVIAVIVIGGTGSLAAFADYKDVAVTNPLYNLKRASEQARLVFTPEEKKPVVHVALAERRLKELEQVQPEPAKAQPVARKADPAADAGIAAQQTFKATSISMEVETTPVPTETPLPIEKKLTQDLNQEIENVFSATATVSAELKVEAEKEKIEEQKASESLRKQQRLEETKARLCRALNEAIKKGVIEERRAVVIEKRCERQD